MFELAASRQYYQTPRKKKVCSYFWDYPLRYFQTNRLNGHKITSFVNLIIKSHSGMVLQRILRKGNLISKTIN